MKTFRSKRPCFAKPIFTSFLFMLFLVGCGSGGSSTAPNPPTTTILEGSAFIPGGNGIPKPDVSNKILPGTTEFSGATVTARSLSTGIVHPGAAQIGADGAFKINDVPLGQNYLISARKGTAFVMKIFSVPAGTQNPLMQIGEVDAASTAAVLALEAFINESLPTPIELDKDLPGDTDLSDLIESGDAGATENEIRNIINVVVNASGDVDVNINLDIFNDSQGIPDADRIAITNIYLTVFNILKEGDQTADESNPDALADWQDNGLVAGNTVITTTIVNNFGTIIINNGVPAEPADLNNNLDVITKPETTITSGPSNPTPNDFATFSFISSRPDSTFKCALGGLAFSDCISPLAFTELPLGSHVFCVVTTDSDGNIDPTPACFEWTIDLPDVPINFAQDPPTAVTLPVGTTTTTSAVLASLINPEGTETRAYFEWGVDTNYGNTTALKEVGSGFNNISISENLIGLTSATEYHFRVVSVNLWGITVGNDQSFVTD